VDSFLETLKNLGAGRLAMLVLTFFGLMVFFVFIALRSGAPSMTLLYGNLSTADATEISAKLDNVHIPYAMSADGTKISVQDKNVSKARMLLAEDGLPHEGSMGYEIFDQKQSFGTTSFQQNINALRALEGELDRTIGTIDLVRSARVHLVLPQRELFSRETQPASASVFLNLRNSAAMGAEQVQAIQHLVAAAVPQLKAVNVAIIDQNGNMLASGEDNQDTATAANAADLRQKYERRLTRSVEDMIGRIVGYGKVRANVSADINFDVVNRSSESYNPDGQVVRSTQSVDEKSADKSSSAGGTASVQNNLPGLPSSSGDSSGSSNSRTEETTNYEISKTVENLTSQTGQVKRLSIAVLVDGRYEPDSSAQKPADAPADWQPPKKYVPRSQEELDKIAALVKSAVGFDAKRGDQVDVVNMQFAENDMFDASPIKDNTILGFARSDIMSMAETLALSIVAVLVILLVLRPLALHFAGSGRQGGKGGLSAQEETALLPGGQAPQAQLTGPGGMQGMGGAAANPSELESMIDMGSVDGKVKASSVQKISDLVTSHPNETVSVIRQWMSQEG
jgi:flagellar M-ring protein FliF